MDDQLVRLEFRCHKICKNCPLKIQGREFFANLMLFPFDEFNVILSMDCLTHHDIVVSYKHKRIWLKSVEGEMIKIKAGRSDCPTNIIFVITARELNRKECDVYMNTMIQIGSSSYGGRFPRCISQRVARIAA
ncbi:hypothetical protein EPI10_016515 [Gossypium australe]|uniref:Uncharacterized protein n=1 Tax=Gossypium australe TaxID=47621 RepID=A0A5B6VP62_9ROSI|nr:hypothetical protein EPI10_016515 [Gossypium australe]